MFQPYCRTQRAAVHHHLSLVSPLLHTWTLCRAATGPTCSTASPSSCLKSQPSTCLGTCCGHRCMCCLHAFDAACRHHQLPTAGGVLQQPCMPQERCALCSVPGPAVRQCIMPPCAAAKQWQGLGSQVASAPAFTPAANAMQDTQACCTQIQLRQAAGCSCPPCRLTAYTAPLLLCKP